MINSDIKRKKKLEKLLKIANIDDKKLNKLNYKEKQKYFKAKRSLGKIFFKSVDSSGKGITYIKSKEVKQSEK